MVFQFSFRHMESSPALQEYAEKKVREKIFKYATKPTQAHITFSVDKLQHTAHCAVTGGDGFNLQVEHDCGDMYGSVDMMVDKLEAQLKKQKEKIKGHRGDKEETRRVAEMAADARLRDAFDSAIDAKDVVENEKLRLRANGRH